MVKKLYNLLKNGFIRTKWVFTNPGDAFAKFLYWKIFKGDREKIPYPIFNFVNRYNGGGWSGMGIYISRREREYKVKVNNFLNKIIPIVFFTILIIILYIGATQSTDKFFYCIAQNLVSDIILIFLIIYIFPKYLNPPKKYKVELIVEHPYVYPNHSTIELSIQNVGHEVYKIKEIYWEIFGGMDIKKEDISLLKGNIMDHDDILINSKWKMYGHNETPLFLDQKQSIAKIKLKDESSINLPENKPLKIYYRLYTINGNLPLDVDVTHDFDGFGVEPSKYPQLGEISLS